MLPFRSFRISHRDRFGLSDSVLLGQFKSITNVRVATDHGSNGNNLSVRLSGTSSTRYLDVVNLASDEGANLYFPLPVPGSIKKIGSFKIEFQKL